MALISTFVDCFMNWANPCLTGGINFYFRRSDGFDGIANGLTGGINFYFRRLRYMLLARACLTGGINFYFRRFDVFPRLSTPNRWH